MKNTKLFKVKKDDVVTFNDDFVIINDALGIHKDFIILDNPLFQDKINKNESFRYSFGDMQPAPKVAQILPKYSDDYNDLELLNLYTKRYKDIDVLCINLLKTYIATFSTRYIDFLATVIRGNLMQKSQFEPACIFDTETQQPIALIMPTTAKTDIYKLEHLFDKEIA